MGQERIVEHQGLLLQPEICTLPAGVPKVFKENGWLVKHCTAQSDQGCSPAV